MKISDDDDRNVEDSFFGGVKVLDAVKKPCKGVFNFLVKLIMDVNVIDTCEKDVYLVLFLLFMFFIHFCVIKIVK